MPGRGQGIDGGAEPRQRIDERMDGAAAFEVAGDRDLHVPEALVLRAQREQVAQGLRRMLVAAVAAIDHRYLRIFGGKPRGAVARVADDDDVGIIADDPDGVGEAFALGGGTHRGIGAGDLVAAEPQHGALERQPRAGRRLVEQAGENVFRRDAAAAADAVGDVFVRQFLQKPRATWKIVSISLLVRSLIETMWRVSGWGFVIKAVAIGPIGRGPGKPAVPRRTDRAVMHRNRAGWTMRRVGTAERG